MYQVLTTLPFTMYHMLTTLPFATYHVLTTLPFDMYHILTNLPSTVVFEPARNSALELALMQMRDYALFLVVQ